MLAKEGYPYILVTAATLLLLLILPIKLILVVGFLLLLLFLWFFRDPTKVIPVAENAVVSAADGRVVEVSVVELNGVQYQKVGVFMNVFSVHVNRVPFTGEITSIKHHAGKFLNAASPEASHQNERNEFTIETEYGTMVIVQVAGLLARRCVSYFDAGDPVAKGDRLGMIKFSSRVDHYFPMNFEIVIANGASVSAGESIIATVGK